jgi:hypothetical protein
MRQWRADGFPELPRRSSILAAIEGHDNGWQEVDAAPLVDAESGRILDFVTALDSVRRGVWPRAIERMARTPHAAFASHRVVRFLSIRTRGESYLRSGAVEQLTSRFRSWLVTRIC